MGGGFLFPRTVEVHRVKTNAGAADTNIGLVGYSGQEVSTTSSQGETVLFTGVPASIQAMSAGRKRDSVLPQDITSQPQWKIIIPYSAMAQGSIRDRDIIVDDEGYRYEVAQAYWNSLGYQVRCVRLEA